MDQKKIECACSQKFTEEEFKRHFNSCIPFRLQFKEFDSKFGKLLKLYSEPEEKLLIVKFLLKQYINIIDKKLRKYYLKLTQDALSSAQINGRICQRCKVNPDVGYLACLHPICTNCFIKYAEQEFYNMKCNICQKKIDDHTKKIILGEEKFNKIESQAPIGMLGGNLIKCPLICCGKQSQFESRPVDYNIRNNQNKVISKISDNNVKKCRYCYIEIEYCNRDPDDDVCNQNYCKESYMISCKERLPCGHKCFGVNGELKCPPCIDNECKDFNGKFGQGKYDYCIICHSEGLGSSPIVELSCGHYVHYLCLKKRLETKWIGPRITFNHCVCPSCNKWFDCKSVPEIQIMIDENKKLYDRIIEISLKRLTFEELDKDPRLTDPNSPWFMKKVEFALKRLSYYMCYVCKNPYFAGIRECGNDPNMNDDDPNKNYNPKDCICGKEIKLSGVLGKYFCSKHGKDFIEYKCKFCCKIAAWFCWGTTHFCEDCHKRQCNNDYVSKYPKDKLPKCNRATCEVGGNHPPNGEEFALGCYICKDCSDCPTF